MGLWRSLVVDVFEVLLARNAWEKRKLGETNSYFTDGNYGESYPKESELSDKENGVPFLRGSNLRNGELIEDNANYITKEKHAELTSGHLVEDDIVLAVRGSLGALGYVKDENIDWNINSQLAVIRTDKSELSGKFLVQFLLSWRGQKELLSRNTGTALKQLPIKQLKDVPVPIVNLDEQKEIGALFSSIDNLIAATQDKIDALEQAKKALLQRLFDQSWRFKGYSDPWEKRKFKDLVVRVNKTSDDSTIPSVEFEDIISKQGRLNKDVRLKINSKQGIYFEPQDVLFGKLRPYLQNWLFPSFYGRAVGDFWVLRANSSVLSEYLFVLIQSPRFQIVANISSGTKMPRSDWNTVSNTSFPIPVQSEQRKIWQLFNVLDNLIAATQSRLSSLELLKKSLLQDLFI